MENESDYIKQVEQYEEWIAKSNTKFDILPLIEKLENTDFIEIMLRAKEVLARKEFLNGNMKSSLSISNELIGLAKKNNFEKVVGSTLVQRSSLYSGLGNSIAATNDLFESLAIWEKLKNQRNRAVVLEILGIQFRDSENYEEAEKYLLEAYEVNLHAKEVDKQFYIYANLAGLYLKMKAFDKALKFANNAIALSSNGVQNSVYCFAHTILGKIQQELGDTSAALESFNETIVHAERYNITIHERNGKLAKAVLLLSRGRNAEAKKELLNLDFDINDFGNAIDLHKSLYEIYYQEEDFKKAIKHLNLWNGYQEKFSGVQYKNHRDKLEASYQNKLKEKEKEILRLQKIEMEQKAIRAQLNPHFFFNALNSINKFILDNDQKNASKFLQNFSGLMRKTLENSEDMFITIEDEIAFLKDYLSLEQLRFNNSFSFEFVVDDEIEEDFVKIPTMLLQPYVENAIKHGVNGKENGKISIDFSYDSFDVLHCAIEDNGHGRKLNSGGNHTSIGTKLLKERMTALSEQFQIEFSIETTDLVDKENKPKGTRVDIKIPSILS